MAKGIDITEDPQMAETYKRFAFEIANKMYALAYIAVKDCISQKEYCKRVGLDETKFSRVLHKIEENIPVGEHASYQTT